MKSSPAHSAAQPVPRAPPLSSPGCQKSVPYRSPPGLRNAPAAKVFFAKPPSPRPQAAPLRAHPRKAPPPVHHGGRKSRLSPPALLESATSYSKHSRNTSPRQGLKLPSVPLALLAPSGVFCLTRPPHLRFIIHVRHPSQMTLLSQASATDIVGSWRAPETEGIELGYYFYPDGVLILRHPRSKRFAMRGAWALENGRLVISDVVDASQAHSDEERELIRSE